ncbi:hypothetical protein R5R35_003789 [Gryllus longicercus]|uniref:Epsilon-sarcoglycan n=1 Tax=Gryllus longicercus TaxID=2509291 RepID=A0AAN9VNP7_9ORTH
MFYILILLSVFGVNAKNANMTELFVIPIHPQHFNWTLKGAVDEFSYHPSLLNAPDLPQWIHYVYSKVHHTGYLYGVPPINQHNLELEIVGLNRRTYETRRKVLPVNVHRKSEVAKYEAQLKIDNLNVEDMIDENRQRRLLDVFKLKLWPESKSDLYVTFLASAVQLGARLPLKPNEGEGVVLRVGSQFEFSSALIELQEEVKPLWKLISCPRDFKRTTVDRLFREEGFALDWCAFRLMTVKETDRSLSQQHSSHGESDLMESHLTLGLGQNDRWSRPAKSQIPQRSYVHEFAFTILVPMLVMILLVVLLSLILCFHHEGMDEASSEYFESVFDIFEEMRSKRNKETPAVQMVQYAAVQRATHTLRSLSSQREVSNTPSEICSTTLSRSRTASPNSSLPRSNATRGASDCNTVYCRPNPPPYSGPNRKQVVAEWLA